MTSESLAKIKVVGIGVDGSNTIHFMREQKFQDVELIAARLQLGAKEFKGVETSSCPVRNRGTILENLEGIKGKLDGADIVFIVAGLDKEAGTEGAEIVAKLSKETGALTIALVKIAPQCEESRNDKVTTQGLKDLHGYSDALILIPSQEVNVGRSPRPFSYWPWTVSNAVKAISESILRPGMINISIRDLREHFQGNRVSRVTTGRGCGENAAIIASKAALSSALFKGANLLKAQSLFIIMIAGTGIHLSDIDESLKIICNDLSDNASVITSLINDETINERAFLITFIAQFYAE